MAILITLIAMNLHILEEAESFTVWVGTDGKTAIAIVTQADFRAVAGSHTLEEVLSSEFVIELVARRLFNHRPPVVIG